MLKTQDSLLQDFLFQASSLEVLNQILGFRAWTLETGYLLFANVKAVPKIQLIKLHEDQLSRFKHLRLKL